MTLLCNDIIRTFLFKLLLGKGYSRSRHIQCNYFYLLISEGIIKERMEIGSKVLTLNRMVTCVLPVKFTYRHVDRYLTLTMVLIAITSKDTTWPRLIKPLNYLYDVRILVARYSTALLRYYLTLWGKYRRHYRAGWGTSDNYFKSHPLEPFLLFFSVIDVKI